MLQKQFYQLLQTYTPDSTLADALWSEITTRYSEPQRHYHTLEHLQFLVRELEPVKAHIQDWDTLLFTLYYHDIVYEIGPPDNEARSADLAAARMKAAGVPTTMIERCKQQILATRHHTLSEDPDTNYFTDADLAILGQDDAAYQKYSLQIRREYAVYPDALYNPGRKQILDHFLQMDRIFKTDYFFERYEQPARLNLIADLRG